MLWKVIDGPAKRAARVDGTVMDCVIENVADPSRQRFIGVTFSRTVLQSERAGLDRPVREAIESDGMTLVERVLDLEEPPEMFLVTSSGIRVERKEEKPQ